MQQPTSALFKARAHTIVMTICVCLYFYLFVTLLFFSDHFLAGLGIAGNETTRFLARRTSMLMLGFSVLSFQAIRIRSAQARQAILATISINMTGFAIMSYFEFFRGFAGAALLQAGIIETMLAAASLALWLAGRSAARQKNQCLAAPEPH